MERILVGVDSSPAARDALVWSADVAWRAGVRIVVARVFVPTQAEISPDFAVELHDTQRRGTNEWSAFLPEHRLRRPPSSSTATPRTRCWPPPRPARRPPRRRGRGAGGFTHLHLGSVAHHLAHHTTIPLAIVPRTGAVPVSHLVVGVDGSPASLAAVDVSAELAARLEVGVTAVYAFDPLAEWVPETDPRSWHHQADADVRRWAAPVEKVGVTVDVDVDRDIHPVAAIGRALDAHPGSVACVGTRGLGGFSGLRLGRVPLQLVHHFGAAVILVPSALGR